MQWHIQYNAKNVNFIISLFVLNYLVFNQMSLMAQYISYLLPLPLWGLPQNLQLHIVLQRMSLKSFIQFEHSMQQHSIHKVLTFCLSPIDTGLFPHLLTSMKGKIKKIGNHTCSFEYAHGYINIFLRLCQKIVTF